MSSAKLRLKASDYALKLRLDKTLRQARLRHSQSENWRRIGNYVANQHFLRELRVFNFFLVPNPEPVNGYEAGNTQSI